MSFFTKMKRYEKIVEVQKQKPFQYFIGRNHTRNKYRQKIRTIPYTHTNTHLDSESSGTPPSNNVRICKSKMYYYYEKDQMEKFYPISSVHLLFAYNLRKYFYSMYTTPLLGY